MDTRPGLPVRVLGTLAAIAGAIIIFFNHNRPSNEFGVFVGGLLVLGGLLLRIEAAVRERRNAER